MPDISMCKVSDCPLSDTCYRFTATPEPLGQFYLIPVDYLEGNCDLYWSINPVIFDV